MQKNFSGEIVKTKKQKGAKAPNVVMIVQGGKWVFGAKFEVDFEEEVTEEVARIAPLVKVCSVCQMKVPFFALREVCTPCVAGRQSRGEEL